MPSLTFLLSSSILHFLLFFIDFSLLLLNTQYLPITYQLFSQLPSIIFATYHLFIGNTHLKLVRRLCSQKLSAHGLIARLDRQQQWDFATLVCEQDRQI